MRSHRGPLWCLLLAALGALGASEPEVVRVRVPSDQVSRWFPTGSDLQVLPIGRFEDLVRAAGERTTTPAASRVLKARHSARWEEGRLVGRSELTIESPTQGASGLLVLDPWSPALVDRGAGSKRLRAFPDGRLGLRFDPSNPPIIEFEWILSARPGSDGRAFSLALPGVELSSLTLELPARLVPEASAGPRLGPSAGPASGRSTWRFEAARGKFDLRLRDPLDDSGRSDASGLWLEGTTRVSLGANPIDWRADWTLDESPGASRELTIECDPGLEVVDVVGPSVGSFRFNPAGLGSILTIRLVEDRRGPSPLTIRAICRAPAEGTWSVPSARPRNATWLGGRTLVRIDAGRVLQGCLERSGRRVPPRTTDQAVPSELIFESGGGVGPVADLSFGKPSSDATVEVRGLLGILDEAPRMTVALTWAVEKGRVLSFSADLPPGWTTDGVAAASGLPIPWHVESLGSGGTRVYLGAPPLDEANRSGTLTLTASARGAGVTGPLDLPRVRPSSGARLVDEVWVATTNPGLTIKPILARGLAWLDPPSPGLDAAPCPWTQGDLEGALAWRWLAEDAEARIDRAPPGEFPRGEVRLEATIRAARVVMGWTIEVESPRTRLDPIPIHVDGPVDTRIVWRAGEPGGSIIEARPLNEARRALLGFPPTGPAWDLMVPVPSSGKLAIFGRAEGPWKGRGQLPLITLPERYRAWGLMTIVVEESTRVKLDSAGLSPIEAPASWVEPSTATGEAGITPRPRLRKAATFGYRSGGGRLTIETSDSAGRREGGLIREAFLVSHISPGAGSRHRLSLSLAADSSRTIGLKMPPGVSLDRLRRDGLAVTPIVSGPNVLVVIPEPEPGRPLGTLTLDYRTVDDPRLGPIEPARLLPTFSLPCLSFAWEIVAPAPWELSKVGRGLEATSPRPNPSVFSRVLGFHWTPWVDRGRAESDRKALAMLADLDKAATDIGEGEANLGDWIVKLDAGRWPVVVDRLAIRSGHRGPGSRLDSTPGAPRPLGPVRSVLEPMGLVAVPLGGMILITEPDEATGIPEDREVWASALRLVASEGSDPTDRFQSAARWRAEATPRALAAGEMAERPRSSGGWRSWRVVSDGWPPLEASASLVDGRADRAWGWLVASSLLTAGLLARNRPPRSRALGLAIVGVVASVGLAWQWPETSSTGSGLIRGGLAVMACWLGRSFRKIPAPTSTAGSGEVSTTSRRSGFLTGLANPTALFLGLVLGLGMALGSAAALVAADGEAPILALLPFDGPADPNSKPDRVVLLLKDRERLELLGRKEARHPTASASLTSAIHKVGRDEPGLATVESTFEAEVGGPDPGPATWTVPVGFALELSATVDDRPSPLAISPDGGSATLTLGGTGAHRFRVRRLVALSKLGQGGERLLIPINRAAFARVAVAKGAGPAWVEVVNAAGEVSVRPEGVEGALGPLDQLEVRWFSENRPPSPGLAGPVEATFLWDARPAGDLIRSRLVHSEPEGPSTIRVAAEPGLLLRRHAIPNLVSIRLEGPPERPEWLIRVDPPWPRRVPIELDFWRPANPGLELRRWPGVDMPTASRFSGLIGFRRPSDWTGRLASKGPVDAASVVIFAKAWGMLPDDGLTLAGVVRAARSETPEVTTGPVRSRRSIGTKVRVDLAPGRLNASIEGTLTDLQGRSFALEVAIPTDFRVVRVDASGLLDWQRVARNRLRLQFDGSEVAERKIRLDGYLPIAADSAMAEAPTFLGKVPWPRWIDAESTRGTLEIAGPTRVAFDPGGGVAPPPMAGVVTVDGRFQTTYRVDDPADLPPLRWGSPPSKVRVAVESELSVDPSSLTWTAALTCYVSGGPAESLQWNLPTEWAKGATLEVEGTSHQLISQASGTGGETTLWTIRPDSPIWGRARLTLRSRRPFTPGREFGYPQVAPRALPGRGAVERYDLAIQNVSGRSMEVSGSSGLQPIDASKFHSVDFSASSSSRSVDHAYHVTGERWSLRLKVGRTGDEGPSLSHERDTRVASAQLACVVRSDGETWGRARFDLEPRPGPFLAVGLPERAEIPWISVDDEVGPALPDGPGRWLIPLGDRPARRVILAWHRPRSGPGLEPIVPLVLPTLDRPASITLISIDGPENLELVPALEGRGIEPIGRVGWMVEEVEQMARRVVDSLGNFDRTSATAREQILDEMAEMELRVRQVQRIPKNVETPLDPTPGRVQVALALIVEASQAAGLDDLIQEARARVGLAPQSEEAIEGPAMVRPEVVRLRPSHEAHFFRALAMSPSRPWSLTFREKSIDRRAIPAGSWAVGGLGSLFWVGVGGLIARGVRPDGRLAIGLLLLASLPLLAWEPIATMTFLGLVTLGRVCR